MSGDSSSVGAGSPPGVFERAPAAAQAGLAALATAVADAEHRAAELAEAFDERTAELTQARERPTKSAAKVRALVSHPFSSKLRRACRERLRGVPPGPARLPNSHGAEAALTSARVSSTVEHAYTEPQAERPLAAPYGPIYKVLKSDASAHKLQAATHRLRSDPAEFRTLFIKNEWPAELREQLGFGKAVWE